MHTIETLNVWLEPFDVPVGTIALDSEGGLSFEYSNQYLSTGIAIPISLALPIANTKFGDVETRSFFGNLTPEGFQASTVASYFRVSPHDVFGLLQRLGGDCPGAISCLPIDAPGPHYPFMVPQDYSCIPPAEIADAVSSLRRGITPANGLGSSCMLAGAQEKIGIACTKSREQVLWQARKLAAPSTHFIKVPKEGDAHSAFLEPLFAQIAAKVGLKVANVKQITLGGTRCILVERFDREVSSENVVKRAHAEDLAQASSTPSLLKYERNGLNERRFSATSFGKVLAQTKDPEKDRRDLFLLTIFNAAIGNTDNHAKNHSLLYTKGMQTELAPAYDLLPISFIQPKMQELAFDIGNAKCLDDIVLEDWLLFAKDIGIQSEKVARCLVAREGSLLLKKLEEELTARLIPGYVTLGETIRRRADRMLSQFKGAMPKR